MLTPSPPGLQKAAQVAKISRATDDGRLIPVADVEDLPSVIAEANERDHILLQPENYNGIEFSMPPSVFMTVLPGAFLDYSKVSGAITNIADLNNIAALTGSATTGLIGTVNDLKDAFEDHVVDFDNPHQVTAEQVLGFEIDDSDIADGRVLRYDSTSNTFVYADLDTSTEFDSDELRFTESPNKNGQPDDPNLYLGLATGPDTSEQTDDYILTVFGTGGALFRSLDPVFGGLHLDFEEPPTGMFSNVINMLAEGTSLFTMEMGRASGQPIENAALEIGGLQFWQSNFNIPDAVSVGADVLGGDLPDDDTAFFDKYDPTNATYNDAVFHVYGSMRVQGIVRASKFSELSSIKFKKEIKSFEATDLWHKFMEINPVTYRLKGNRNADTEYGFIAEELEMLFPELVHTDPDTGTKSVQYSRVTPLLVKTIQDLKKRLKIQEESISELQHKLRMFKTIGI